MTTFLRENIVFVASSLLLTGVVSVTSQLQNTQNPVLQSATHDSAQVIPTVPVATAPLAPTTPPLPVPAVKTVLPEPVPSINTPRRHSLEVRADDD